MVGPVELTDSAIGRLESIISSDGLAVIPTDTLYGIACNPNSLEAAGRLYKAKGRDDAKSAAVMFATADAALAAMPEIDDQTRAVIEQLLPGPYTLILPNPEQRFAAACREDRNKVGLRVPMLEGRLAPLAKLGLPMMQTSCNRSGEPAPAALADAPGEILAHADIVLDAGRLSGIASAVVDLSEFASKGAWRLLRERDSSNTGHLTEQLGPPQ